MKIGHYHKFLFLLLALNYFAYQCEFFDHEYAENHRVVSSHLSVAPPSVTWETFDKTNAPKAFVLNVEVTIDFLGYLRLPDVQVAPRLFKFDIVRDKSPPQIASAPS